MFPRGVVRGSHLTVSVDRGHPRQCLIKDLTIRSQGMKTVADVTFYPDKVPKTRRFSRLANGIDYFQEPPGVGKLGLRCGAIWAR